MDFDALIASAEFVGVSIAILAVGALMILPLVTRWAVRTVEAMIRG